MLPVNYIFLISLNFYMKTEKENNTPTIFFVTPFLSCLNKLYFLTLLFLHYLLFQRHVYAWALDHRVHHKYSETDADPHNAKRGFWFSHVGWLVLTPHPDVVAKRKAVDMSDLEADPIVMWQKRYIYIRISNTIRFIIVLQKENEIE